MRITIRRAEASDIETIQKYGSKLLNFERENFDSSLDEKWAFSDEAKAKYLGMIQDQYVIIAEVDGESAGYLIGSIIKPKVGDARQIKQAYLQNLYVDETLRETGVGKKMVENFKIYCQSEGVKRLNVSVIAANEAATKFYSAIGFKPRSLNLSQEI